MPENVRSLPRIDRSLTKLGSKGRGTDIILSAPQVRAARSLLGWSRRELAIVSGVSSGTIKALEQGSTDPRLSTLRKLARTFKAHSVEFLIEGHWTGVVIAMTPDLDQRRKVARNIPGQVKPTEQGEAICEVNAPKTSGLKPLGRWFAAPRRAKTA
jgi:transcriptional regulator with XRE-family HTH domain